MFSFLPKKSCAPNSYMRANDIYVPLPVIELRSSAYNILINREAFSLFRFNYND